MTKTQIDMNKQTKILNVNLIKNNYVWVITTLTFIGALINKLFEYIEYITSEQYFTYYGLNHNLYSYSDKGFLYGLATSILVELSIILSLISIHQIKNKKVKVSKKIVNLLLIVVYNSFIISIIPKGIRSNYEIVNIIYITVLEIIIYIIGVIIFKLIKVKRIYLIDVIKFVPIAVVLLILINGTRVNTNLQADKSYYIINNDKVIVYSTKDYYLTLDCEILNGNELKIYKGQQEKIDNNNIKTKLIEFDKVEIINQTKQ